MTLKLYHFCAAALLALASAAGGANDAVSERPAIAERRVVSGTADVLPGATLAYPTTRRMDLVETRFGKQVADPYRWLEDDARADPDVAAWISSQNGVTQDYLARLPGRDALRARMTALYDYERYGVPKKGGQLYFYTYNSGLQNQSVLFVREGLDGKARLLLDPASFSADGSSAWWCSGIRL